MAEVFLSYKRDERTAIEQIATRLRALGLSVWFDASMSAGETFNAEIDREARAASVILVCWSPAARQSEWVNAEAMIGFEQKKLAACYVAGPDTFSAPTPFNATHAEDLRAWLAAPSETHAGWKSVLRRIGKLCGRADIETWGALDAQANTAELRAWIAAHEASPLFMTVDVLLRARKEEDAERARLEQAARERRAVEEAERQTEERLAREEAERHAHEERQHGSEDDPENSGRGYLVALLIVVVSVFLFVVAMDQAPRIWGSKTDEEASDPPSTDTTSALGAGQEFDDCNGATGCPRMVVIPTGSFVMGSPRTETGHYVDEEPQRRVTIAQFAVSKFEITRGQWAVCVSRGGCASNRNPRDAYAGETRTNLPRTDVSWYDAQEYVRWLAVETGGPYRLLTEAEWEYAARAGTTSAYSTGPILTATEADVLTTLANSNLVGAYPANAFGLHDMHGNVWEWVQDCYVASYTGLPVDGSAHNADGCEKRVLRGGGNASGLATLRSAARGYFEPTAREMVGFRVARSL